MQSPSTFKHLSHRGTQAACILAQKKSVSSVCSQQVTACFMSASVANHLAAKCCLRWSKEMEVVLPTRLVTGYSAKAGKLRTTVLTVPLLYSVTSISLNPLRSNKLARHLQQMPKWSKQPLPGYRHLTKIASMLEYKPWHHSWTNS